MLKKLLTSAVVLVVVIGAAFWWFIIRSDEPAELSVGDDTSASEPTGETPETLDGTWTVQTGGDTTAGFRITESFAGGLTDHVAVGRSDEVAGSIEVGGSEVTKGSFTIDLTALAFDDDPGLPVANRVNAMADRGLQIDTFPEATFELTAPVDFGEAPTPGAVVTAEATGDLTIHGVTKEVTFTIEAKRQGTELLVATADPVPVVLADFDIEKPTGGPIAEIADEGSFEFLVVLAAA